MVEMVADALGKEVLVPNHPQMMGALGAAMIMAEKQ
jgi:activator of 2-hydroxyglutaryl-CoA dehydratase